MNNWWPSDLKLRIGYIFVFTMILASVVGYFVSPEHLFEYQLAAQPEAQNLTFEYVSVGPFGFELKGQQYMITEAFSISELTQVKWHYLLISAIIWLGMTGFLAVASFWKRYWFLFVAGLFLLQIHQLALDSIGLLGSDSGKWASALLMAFMLLPAYYFHAFSEKTPLLIRWLALFCISGALLGYFQLQNEGFYLYFMSRGVFGASVLTLFFLFLISEEIIFMILMIITGSKGGKSNEKHLIIFSALYLAYMTLYWADKMGLIRGDWDFLNPFYLLILSSLVATATIAHKQFLINSISHQEQDVRWLFVALAMTTMGLLTLGFSSGNDNIKDGIEYMTLYTHIGFGVMFLLYLIVNFITPLIQGLKVYKIAYTEQNFPYITSRLGGLVFVVALFLYGEQLPLRRIQAAHYNILGDYHTQTNPSLAKEYYEESAVFGWDNHYASMQLGKMAEKESNLNEAIYRYTRATTRNHSPQAYLAAGNVLQQSKELTRAIGILKQGLLDYPSHPEITNNLALLLAQSGASLQAKELLSDAKQTEEWNDAVNVNRLALRDTTLLKELIDPSIQVMANLQALLNESNFEGSTKFQEEALSSPLTIHKLIYLINSGWSSRPSLADSTFQSILQTLRNPQLTKNLQHTHAYNLMINEEMVRAIDQWNKLISSVSSLEKGFFYHQLGVLYLSIQAPQLAYYAFEEANFFKYDEAHLGMAVAAMELKQWNTSREHWKHVIKVDSSYATILDLIGSLEISSEIPSFASIYYNLPSEWSIYAENVPFFRQEEVNMLWNKAFDLWSETGKSDFIQNFFELEENRLGETEKLDYLLYRSSGNNIDSLTVQAARENPFEEWRVLAVANTPEISDQEKYETLVQAIIYNPYRPELIKAYSRSAVDLGLYEYAEQATLRLLTLISAEEYQQFEREIFDRRQKREEELGSWGS